MTVPEWLAWATADAERRHLPSLKPLLEGLARAMLALRAADFNDNAAPVPGDKDRTHRDHVRPADH